MNCADFRSQLQSSPGNAGTDARLVDYTKHFQNCSPCREFARAMLDNLTKELERFLRDCASSRARAHFIMAKNANLNLN